MKIEYSFPSHHSWDMIHGEVYRSATRYYIAGPEGVTDIQSGHHKPHSECEEIEYTRVRDAKLVIGP